MALERLESTLRALIGNRDPKQLSANLGVRVEDQKLGSKVLVFSISIPSVFPKPMVFLRPSMTGISVESTLSGISEFGEPIYATGMKCRVVPDASAEGIMMEARRKYQGLREIFDGSRSDLPATYDLDKVFLERLKLEKLKF